MSGSIKGHDVEAINAIHNRLASAFFKAGIQEVNYLENEGLQAIYRGYEINVIIKPLKRSKRGV